jgi:hypothetical protein
VEWLAREAHTYEVPPFTDPDGDELTYTAELYGGAPLPSWLAFDGQNPDLLRHACQYRCRTVRNYCLCIRWNGCCSGDSFTLTVVTNPFRIVLRSFSAKKYQD